MGVNMVIAAMRALSWNEMGKAVLPGAAFGTVSFILSTQTVVKQYTLWPYIIFSLIGSFYLMPPVANIRNILLRTRQIRQLDQFMAHIDRIRGMAIGRAA